METHTDSITIHSARPIAFELRRVEFRTILRAQRFLLLYPKTAVDPLTESPNGNRRFGASLESGKDSGSHVFLIFRVTLAAFDCVYR